MLGLFECLERASWFRYQNLCISSYLSATSSGCRLASAYCEVLPRHANEKTLHMSNFAVYCVLAFQPRESFMTLKNNLSLGSVKRESLLGASLHKVQ